MQTYINLTRSNVEDGHNILGKKTTLFFLKWKALSKKNHFARFKKTLKKLERKRISLLNLPHPTKKRRNRIQIYFFVKITQTFCLHSFPCSQHQNLMRLTVYLNTLHVFLCRVSVEKNINIQ